MAQFPRGIDPALLVSQVRNTMPYVFEDEKLGQRLARAFPPLRVLRDFEATQELSHLEYFELCVSAHYSSCGTPVPTDVDNQIRKKLWPQDLPIETALEMSKLVLESRAWDFSQVSNRYVFGAEAFAGERISGHLGEWFTLSSAAYCALSARKKIPPVQARLTELFEAIGDEVRRHSEVFGSLWRSGDGLGCLKASSSIAHNFGDLDRVMDMWELPIADPLRLEFYKLGTNPLDSNRKLRHKGRLWTAGELYKSSIDGSSMAGENHRHFALRKPRVLRSKQEFLIPTGPFFDPWGRAVGEALIGEELNEVIEALKEGWLRLPGTVGYGRALAGILAVKPERADQIELRKPKSQAAFEKHWAEEALKHLDEIPSRAP